MPAGRRTTISRITAPSSGAPVLGLARQRVLQPGEDGGADDTGRQRLHAAEQHHHQAVDRAGMESVRARCCPWRRRRAAPARPAKVPARTKASPLHARARRCRWPRRAAANRGRRAARSRTAEEMAPASTQPAPRSDERQIVIDRLGGEPGGGPYADHAVAAAGDVIPLEDDRPEICANASVSIAR